ncbi:M24 family metallopeptidase [Caulobacter sp. NIBR2454]|uniref:M24 family metallopeptidase n=1 Tax=Caulobacter sp. NIBR2454 TaxID=3015996 RepID=UPI0022B7414A|nr:Xaa-Pro peptidase family protein [Caulobacter sp. NIBR2454]
MQAAAFTAGAAVAPAALSQSASPAPISRDERMARIAKAQSLMRAAGLSGLLVEPGSTMVYFCGVDWWLSERPTVLLLPADGEACMITPAFEADRLRHLLQVPAQVRTWEEHENPFKLLADWTRELGMTKRSIGADVAVRFLISEPLARAGVHLTAGSAIVDGCRMIKSPAEIAIMQRAADITVAAYRQVGARIAAGMAPADITALMTTALRQGGAQRVSGHTLVGVASSFPHGGAPEPVRTGSVILMDFGCTLDGYYADISRTMVFGEPTALQRKVWNHVREGQMVAFEAARIGAPAGSVDDAVRRYYAGLGYTDGLAAPGLTHRTGHGIGLDVHEPINLVRGEATRLAPGMCFSNEPGLYHRGVFGMRIEDCMYLTEGGPRFFSTPPRSIDAPFF